MKELLVAFITSLDGDASAEGWPGCRGLEGPEYPSWLNESPERDYAILMGATTSCEFGVGLHERTLRVNVR